MVSYKFFFARTRILPGKPQDPGNPENAWYAVHPGQQLGNVIILENAFCTESYLLQRFWRQGWIPNKTLSKLGGTDPVIGIGSDLLSAKP